MADEPADEKERVAEIGRRGALAALGALGSAAFIACSSSTGAHNGSGGASGTAGGNQGGTSGATGGSGGGIGGSGGTAAGTGGGAGGGSGGAGSPSGGASGARGSGGVAGASGGPGGGGGAMGASGGVGGASGDGGGSCHEIPEETAGPFPDTKGMIGDPAFHRSDIREDRTGVTLTVTLTIVDVGNGCAPIVGAQVQIWHCDAGGVYSEYANAMNAGSTTTTYLRGVQVTDAAGRVTFKTIYPGWYTPRATHVHVEVYNGTVLKKTTQLGFPDAISAAVYTPTSLVTSFYTKGQNPTTNDADQVFGNSAGTGTDGGGHAYQIAAITGDTNNGFVATIPVGVTGYFDGAG